MAKGGRYLNTNQKGKKKGKAGKIVLTIVLVLALLGSGGFFAFKKIAGSMLSNVQRAEYEEKNQDKSSDDLLAEIYGNMGVSGTGGSGEEEDVYVPEAQDDVYIPENVQQSPETTEPVSE